MEKSKIILSFIIPVYNAQDYLNQCIDSIVSITIENIEIILVDDGSTDLSANICDEYFKKFPQKIKVIHQNNLGVASARNVGMENASGEYIFFIDNDDWIDGRGIEKFFEIINTKKPDIIINRSYIVSRDGSYKINDSFLSEKVNYKPVDKVLNYFRINKVKIGAPWQYIFKSELVFKNNILFQADQGGVDDSYFSAVLFVHSNSFFLNDVPFYFWRQRSNSQGKTFNEEIFIKKMISSIESIKRHTVFFAEGEQKSFLYFNIYKNIYALLGHYFSYSNNSKKNIQSWYYSNIDLIKVSAKHVDRYHNFLQKIFGYFWGAVLAYKLAIIKGFIINNILRQKIK